MPAHETRNRKRVQMRRMALAQAGGQESQAITKDISSTGVSLELTGDPQGNFALGSEADVMIDDMEQLSGCVVRIDGGTIAVELSGVDEAAEDRVIAEVMARQGDFPIKD